MAMIAPGGDDLSPRGHRAAVFDRISLGALYALLMWAPLAFGAHKGWPLAITELLALLAFSTWVLGMLVRERIEWRRTSLDLPLALLVTFVLLQLVLSNRALVSWALGPPAISGVGRVDLPTPLFTLGTVSPAHARAILAVGPSGARSARRGRAPLPPRGGRRSHRPGTGVHVEPRRRAQPPSRPRDSALRFRTGRTRPLESRSHWRAHADDTRICGLDRARATRGARYGRGVHQPTGSVDRHHPDAPGVSSLRCGLGCVQGHLLPIPASS